MQIRQFMTADESEAAGDVIDLAEYLHPADRALAWERLAAAGPSGRTMPVAVILPSDAGRRDMEMAAAIGAAAVIVNEAESAASLERAGQLLDGIGAEASLVPRLTTGRGLYAAVALAAAHPRVAGLWYAPADLLVDFDDDQPMPFYFDAGESRLAAPGWTRSRLLTIARAAGITLWGQLDLSFAAPPPAGERRRAVRLAHLSGFDVLVARYPVAAGVEVPA